MCLFIVIIAMGSVTSAKYLIEYQNKVAVIDIDRNPPKIELVGLQNTNVGYEKYANQTHTITAQIKVTEEHIISNNMSLENLVVQVNGKDAEIQNIKVVEKKREGDSIYYDIILTGIQTEGILSFIIKEGTIVDKSYNVNPETVISTDIQIDNTSPEGIFSETEIEEGKVLATILANEKIRGVEGWKLTQNEMQLEKEFTNNISYIFTITDLAQNTKEIEINISKATNIMITYASHNSAIGWTYGYGNYDVAGAQAVKENPIYKTEALAFRITGNIPEDFVQINTCIYTHWGEGSKATCGDTGMIYQYGYNPGRNLYKTMASDDLVTIDGKKYIQFGGTGMNGFQKTDIEGNNPIPLETVYQYNYGISGVTMKLKDESYYSIVYQILVNGQGWLKTCSDGEEAMYQFNRPMSAIRLALVPKTEKAYILNLWNQDVGTNRIP